MELSPTLVSNAFAALVRCSITGLRLERPKAPLPGYDFTCRPIRSDEHLRRARRQADEIRWRIVESCTGHARIELLPRGSQRAPPHLQARRLRFSLYERRWRCSSTWSASYLAAGATPAGSSPAIRAAVPYTPIRRRRRMIALGIGTKRQFCAASPRFSPILMGERTRALIQQPPRRVENRADGRPHDHDALSHDDPMSAHQAQAGGKSLAERSTRSPKHSMILIRAARGDDRDDHHKKKIPPPGRL